MKRSLWIGMVTLITGVMMVTATWAVDGKNAASGLKAFETSWNADHYVLAFFYSEMNDTVKEKKAGFETIAESLKDQADAHFVDITDPNQSDVVNLYKVDRAPMPLVLVVAPNGAITGGFPQEFTEDRIQNAIVGPLTTQCLKGLQDGKFVFVCVQGDNAAANASAMKGVTDFKDDMLYNTQTEVVIFKGIGPSEQRMMKSLGVDGKLVEPITAFLAPPGAMIGKFTGATDKGALVAALASRQQGGGGCCPGGSGAGKACK